jgi:hypothetical protein
MMHWPDNRGHALTEAKVIDTVKRKMPTSRLGAAFTTLAVVPTGLIPAVAEAPQ